MSRKAMLVGTLLLLPLVALPQIVQRTAGPATMHGHGYCYLWNSTLLSLHITSDALIALAYLSISITLGWIVFRLRSELPFHWMFLAFGTFILACGATHAVEIWTIWQPDFWFSANVKILTAIASVATAVTLPTLAPRVRQTIIDARVSEERRAQLAAAHTALRERQQTVDQFIQALPAAVLVLDRDGRPYYANRLAAALLGADVLSRSVDQHAAAMVRMGTSHPYPTAEVPLQAALAGVAAHADDIEILASDSRLALEIDAAPIFDRDGRVLQAVAVLHDITERKTLEREFAQAQKMQAVGLLAGGIAHDFNNLLTAIYGYAEQLLEGVPPDDPLREPVDQIYKAADRAAGLTRHLLAFSRKQILRVLPLDIDLVLRDMGPMLQRLLPENIQISWQLDTSEVHVVADKSQLEQVILNLVVNARDAMQAGGELIIETALVDLDEEYVTRRVGSRTGPHVAISVTDTGTGMDAATKARIFEPFFTTKGAAGTGLGLSTVYGIVKQSGGNIWVYSEVGQGTTVKVYLPVSSPETETPSAPSASAENGAERILLVEDDRAIRQLCATALRARGYVVEEASDGEAALALASVVDAQIDLLLTDVVLPGMNGRRVADAVLAIHPNAKVLYMSGYTENAIVHTGVLDPLVAFLPKPFTPRTLLERVRITLDEPGK